METLEPAGVNDPLVALLEQITIGAVAMTARSLATAGGDLTLLQWRVLVVTGGEPGGVYVGEIGRRVGASPPSATRVLRRMERQGMLVLTREDGDRRHVRAQLSPDGRRIRDAVMLERRSRIAEAVRRSRIDAGAPGTAMLAAIAAAFVTEG